LLITCNQPVKVSRSLQRSISWTYCRQLWKH